MISLKNANYLFTIIICLVWFVNGFFCKVSGLVPRHQQIVSRIMGDDHAWLFTKVIGAGEVLIVLWILSGIRPRWCGVLQMALVLKMNIIEFIHAPDLLLFGKMNIVFAFLFIVIIFINTFGLIDPRKKNWHEII